MCIINKRPASIKYFLGPVETLNKNLYCYVNGKL